MASIVIQGDTSGSVTLQAPTIAGSTVINLPSTSMNIGTGGGSIATNTAVGASALAANVSGAEITAVGAGAYALGTAGQNEAFGRNAMGSAIVTGGNNSAFGRSSLTSLTSGVANVGFGQSTLELNTTGSYNTAIGRLALLLNTTGQSNIGIGFEALRSNTTGGYNTALGTQAGYLNTTGAENVYVGRTTGYSNTTGNYNSAFGAAALANNTTASYNTAVGHQAGYANTTGNGITAIGSQALYSNTTGTANTAVGTFISSVYAALWSNTTGNNNVAMGAGITGSRVAALALNTTGSNNTAIGTSALSNNTTSSDNTAVGTRALQDSTGASNTAVGKDALGSNTTASQNTAVGFQAAYSNSTGLYNTAIGYQAGYASTGAESRYNTFVGWRAGYNANPTNVNAYGNVCIGAGTGISLTTGYANTIVGAVGVGGSDPAGAALTTGIGNILIGTSAGQSITTGSKNTFIGRYDGNSNSLDLRVSNNQTVLSDGDGNVRLFVTDVGGTMVGSSLPTNATLRGKMTGGGLAVLVGSGTQGFEVWDDNDTTNPRFKVLRDGNVLVGTVSAFDSAYKINLKVTGSTGGLIMQPGTDNYTAARFNTASSAQVGTITVSTTNTTYNTSSDYRLKNTIAPMTGALAKVALLKPCTYKWNVNGSDGEGFIAHELAEVVPHAVTGAKDAVDAEGKPKYQGVDTSFLVATLTAAIQEQQALITTLTERITALEGA